MKKLILFMLLGMAPVGAMDDFPAMLAREEAPTAEALATQATNAEKMAQDLRAGSDVGPKEPALPEPEPFGPKIEPKPEEEGFQIAPEPQEGVSGPSPEEEGEAPSQEPPTYGSAITEPAGGIPSSASRPEGLVEDQAPPAYTAEGQSDVEQAQKDYINAMSKAQESNSKLTNLYDRQQAGENVDAEISQVENEHLTNLQKYAAAETRYNELTGVGREGQPAAQAEAVSEPGRPRAEAVSGPKGSVKKIAQLTGSSEAVVRSGQQEFAAAQGAAEDGDTSKLDALNNEVDTLGTQASETTDLSLKQRLLKRRNLLIALGVGSAAAIALGVGLGVGLKKSGGGQAPQTAPMTPVDTGATTATPVSMGMPQESGPQGGAVITPKKHVGPGMKKAHHKGMKRKTGTGLEERERFTKLGVKPEAEHVKETGPKTREEMSEEEDRRLGVTPSKPAATQHMTTHHMETTGPVRKGAGTKYSAEHMHETGGKTREGMSSMESE